MKEFGVFVDESGTQEGKAVFCVVTYVLHDQADDIMGAVARYERFLAERGLSYIPFHATSLLRAHDAYTHLDIYPASPIHSHRCSRAAAMRRPVSSFVNGRSNSSNRCPCSPAIRRLSG